MQISEGATQAVMESNEAEAGSPGQSVALVPRPNAAGDGASGAARSDEARGLSAAIRRLEDIVDEETAALEARQQIDFNEFTLRKSRSMLEFVRLTRALTHLRSEGDVANDLQRLRLKLERNRALLQVYFEAVREVAMIIAKAIREAESDGTYSADLSRESK
jgi:hypothetical protein